MRFEQARKVADAVLYEGYVLYPYRPSSVKNRFRWQFGIVAPRAWSEQGGEPWEMQTECLVESHGSPILEITVRFLQVQAKPSTPGWDEGVERTVEVHGISLEDLSRSACTIPFEIGGGPAICGLMRLCAEPIDSSFKLRIRVENHTAFPEAEGADRTAAIQRSLVGTHVLLGVSGGAFLSLMDPPRGARAAARSCSNLHTWPVLIGAPGARDTMLSAPVILEDYPAIAPESQQDFCDATEIDELLTLRVMTLTEDEKQEARAASDRARQIIERCDATPLQTFEQLHGAIRSFSEAEGESFFNPADEAPHEASVEISGGAVSRGARVRLAPKRRADSMDLFLAGRTAVVAGVHRDIENRVYVAVTVEDDPAADLQERVGRYFYFYPDELELIGKEI